MKIVTGCAGFIASGLTDRLLSEGSQVIGIDNLNDAYDSRLKEYRIHELQTRFPDQFLFFRGDISNPAIVNSLFNHELGEITAVYNLAARAGVRSSVLDPDVFYQANVTGSLNLLKCCVRYGIPKYVMASTSSLYGNRTAGQTHETDDTSHPISPYAASKKAAETMAYTWSYLHGIDVSILRYFTVYGPAGRPDMSVFRFIRQIDQGLPITLYGDGTQARDFTFVSDIVDGTFRAERNVGGYDIFNLGGNRVVVLNDLIDLIGSLLGKQVRINRLPAQRADIDRTSACTDHAESVLGWSPKVFIEEGIARTIEWYKANRDFVLSLKNEDANPM